MAPAARKWAVVVAVAVPVGRADPAGAAWAAPAVAVVSGEAVAAASAAVVDLAGAAPAAVDAGVIVADVPDAVPARPGQAWRLSATDAAMPACGTTATCHSPWTTPSGMPEATRPMARK